MSGTDGGGTAWVYGDDIDTDSLAPGLYLKGSMEEMAKHCLEAIDPTFAAESKEGDFVVADENFGIGSSRERNAFNVGVVPLVFKDADKIKKGDRLRVDAAAGTIENLTRNETYTCETVPPHLMEIVADGGLMPHLKKKLKGKTT